MPENKILQYFRGMETHLWVKGIEGGKSSAYAILVPLSKKGIIWKDFIKLFALLLPVS